MNFQLVFTAYNRSDYLRQSLKSWKTVRGLKEWPLAAFVEPSSVSSDILCEFFDMHQYTALVHTKLNNTKQGVLVNPWNALNWSFSDENDFTVIAEDDVLVTDDILEYFTWAAEEFKDKSDVGTVCAFSRQGGSDPNEIFTRIGFGSPLIWGTWKDRWENHIRDTWDKTYEHRGWDFRLVEIAKERNLLTVIPRQSRSDHIGQYNGTHMQPQWFDASRGIGFNKTQGPCSYFLGREYD